MIFTDGVEDVADSGGSRTTATFDRAKCDLLKTPVDQGGKGATVYVVHAVSSDNFISMNGVPADVLFNATVSSMSTCASSPSNTHYFFASDKAGITAATAHIIAQALARPALLTQIGGIQPASSSAQPTSN